MGRLKGMRVTSVRVAWGGWQGASVWPAQAGGKGLYQSHCGCPCGLDPGYQPQNPC